MNPNILPSNRAAVLGSISPQSITDAAVSTGWVSVAAVSYVLAVAQTGAVAATGTVDAKIEQASDGSGTGAKDVSGYAITQLTATDDDVVTMINMKSSELDSANGFTFVRLTITDATAAALVSGLLIGMDAAYQPASHSAAVVEVV